MTKRNVLENLWLIIPGYALTLAITELIIRRYGFSQLWLGVIGMTLVVIYCVLVYDNLGRMLDRAPGSSLHNQAFDDRMKAEQEAINRKFDEILEELKRRNS